MTTALEDPETSTRSSISPSQRLRTTMAALRLSFTWFGTRKTLSPEQKTQAAESFGAAGDYLSAGKKLVDTGHPKFKAVTTVRNRAVSYFRAVSLPFPEPGVRLIRQDEVDSIDQKLQQFRDELQDAVAGLDEHFGELQAAARRRLGTLYNASDYPASLDGLFRIDWEFPSIEPPAYLQGLNPGLYEQECQRVAARFDEAVRLAEEAFTAQFAELVAHLTERLSGQQDGKPRVFRDSVVLNLAEFFERFRHLNVRSSEELDQLVAQAQQIARGVQPQALRDDEKLRSRIATRLSSVQSALDELLVDRPRRNILRRPK